MYKIVRSSRLYEQIVQQVEESIQKGTTKPGDQLPPERELAQQFGVSRTAVREAVKALHEKGLVEAYPGRGTFINRWHLVFNAAVAGSDAEGRAVRGIRLFGGSTRNPGAGDCRAGGHTR